MEKLLRHPKPYDDESLSSYLYRLSLKNKCPLEWIIDNYSLDEKHLYSKLNQCTDIDLFNIIAGYTNLTVTELLGMTLTRFNYLEDNYFIKEITQSPNNSKYCPICLRNENYHKLYWQLDIIKICIKHKTLLFNKCVCGRETTLDAVITNKCICGRLLSATPPLRNKYPSVYFNQLKVYNALEISIDSQYEKDEQYTKKYLLACNLKCRYEEDQKYVKEYMSSFKSNYEYLNLVHVLNHLVKTEESSLSLYMNTYLTFPDLFPSLNGILLVERLLDTWPESFYKLLDNINFKINLLYPNYAVLEHFHSYKISPISCLFRTATTQFLLNFKDIIINYFITNYKSFYLNFLNIKPNSCVSIYEIMHLFCLDLDDIAVLTPLKDNCDINYNEVQIILDYFMYFVNNGEVIFINLLSDDKIRYSYNDLVSLYELCKDDKTNYIKLNNVTEMIKEHNLKICINIFDSGLKMIFISKSEIYRYIYTS